jgi:predicted PurR-regulated permease PerM
MKRVINAVMMFFLFVIISFYLLFRAAKLRKRKKKALGTGRKVNAEGESLNKCSEFWAILIIERSGLADSVSSSYLYWIVQIE